MRVLISDAVDKGCIDVLARDRIEVDYKPGLSAEEVQNLIHRYDALVVRSATTVSADIIARASSLRIIGRAGTGVDNIDVAAATRRGILVMNTPGGNTISAAEHTVSLIFALARNIPQANASLRQGHWNRHLYTGTEVFGKTLGIIGLGRIGREVAQRCHACGMEVISYDPVVAPDVAQRISVEMLPLDEVYRRADYITLHIPLTAETHHMVNARTLAECKRGVRIVNCARGGIIDEQALLQALESGQVGGVALDVFEQEPPGQSALIMHDRVVATPHLGASTEEAQEKVAVAIAQQIADALHGRSYVGVVNSAAMHHMLKPEVRPYVDLAEKLGSLAEQITRGKLRRLTVVASGEIASSSLELLKAGVLKGVLSQVQAESVNFVNAPAMAKELGVSVSEQREQGVTSMPGRLIVRYESDLEAHELGGAVYEGVHVRLTMLDGFRIEVNPEGPMLVYNNEDRPGMLARVATILAEHGVNIAGVTLGRVGRGEPALCVMNLDAELTAEALERVVALEGVQNVRYAKVE